MGHGTWDTLWVSGTVRGQGHYGDTRIDFSNMLFQKNNYKYQINTKTNMESPNPRLIYWEEFALSLQEFFQAYDRWIQDPNTPVMHRI